MPFPVGLLSNVVGCLSMAVFRVYLPSIVVFVILEQVFYAVSD